MAKLNQADTSQDYPSEAENLLGHNNVTMTKDEGIMISMWIADQIRMIEESEANIELVDLLRPIAQLIETAANLGQAYSEDQDNAKIEVIVAADYILADEENEQENIDETTKAEGAGYDAAS